MAAYSDANDVAPKRRRLAGVNGEPISATDGVEQRRHSDYSLGSRFTSFVSNWLSPVWSIVNQAGQHLTGALPEPQKSPELRRRVATRDRESGNSVVQGSAMQNRGRHSALRSQPPASSSTSASSRNPNRINGVGMRRTECNASSPIVLDDIEDIEDVEDDDVVEVRVRDHLTAVPLRTARHSSKNAANTMARVNKPSSPHVITVEEEDESDDDDVQVVNSTYKSTNGRRFTNQRASSSRSSEYTFNVNKKDSFNDEIFLDALDTPVVEGRGNSVKVALPAPYCSPPQLVNELREAYGLGSPEDNRKGDNAERSFVTAVEEEDAEDFSTEGTSLSRESSVEFLGELKPTAARDVLDATDGTLQSASPSPQPEQSASRTISPTFVRSNQRGLVDKWKRRSVPNGTPLALRHRTHPAAFSARDDRFKQRLQMAVCREPNSEVINIDARERYRQLLQHVGAEYVSLPASLGRRVVESGGTRRPKKPRDVRLKRLDASDMLKRGREALNFASKSPPSSPHVRSSSSSLRSGDEGNAAKSVDKAEESTKEDSSPRSPRVDGAMPVLNRQLVSPVLPGSCRTITRKYSEQSDWSVGSSTWDAERDESLKARLSAEEPSSLLRRYRLAEHNQDAQLRNRRAEELALERRLREQGRRDEEETLEEELRKKLTLTGYVFRRRIVKPLIDEFPELDDEALSIVNRVWNRQLDMGEKFGNNLTRKDLMTLRGLDWLNDEVINGYLQLVASRCNSDPKLPKVFAFNTFFYTSLLSSGYAKVKRWTKKVDIFAFDLLLVPIHLGAHWCLAVVDFREKRIEYFDSMGGTNEMCLKTLSAYLNDESNDKKGNPFDLSSWELEIRRDIPQQMNGSDCGMFACKFAEFVSRRADIAFSQANMPYYRQRMVYELFTGKLM